MIKIFLLDDDELSNELTTYIIHESGVTDVDACTSGEAALQYLETCKNGSKFPDILFVDINMPGMDGFTFVKQYEKKFGDFHPKTQVILLTNSVLADEKKRAEKHKIIRGLWNKPLTIEKLNDLIRKMQAEKLA
jgi:CheY-like chemotaxis protein